MIINQGELPRNRRIDFLGMHKEIFTPSSGILFTEISGFVFYLTKICSFLSSNEATSSNVNFENIQHRGELYEEVGSYLSMLKRAIPTLMKDIQNVNELNRNAMQLDCINFSNELSQLTGNIKSLTEIINNPSSPLLMFLQNTFNVFKIYENYCKFKIMPNFAIKKKITLPFSTNNKKTHEIAEKPFPIHKESFQFSGYSACVPRACKAPHLLPQNIGKGIMICFLGRKFSEKMRRLQSNKQKYQEYFSKIKRLVEKNFVNHHPWITQNYPSDFQFEYAESKENMDMLDPFNYLGVDGSIRIARERKQNEDHDESYYLIIDSSSDLVAHNFHQTVLEKQWTYHEAARSHAYDLLIKQSKWKRKKMAEMMMSILHIKIKNNLEKKNNFEEPHIVQDILTSSLVSTHANISIPNKGVSNVEVVYIFSDVMPIDSPVYLKIDHKDILLSELNNGKEAKVSFSYKESAFAFLNWQDLDINLVPKELTQIASEKSLILSYKIANIGGNNKKRIYSPPIEESKSNLGNDDLFGSITFCMDNLAPLSLAMLDYYAKCRAGDSILLRKPNLNGMKEMEIKFQVFSGDIFEQIDEKLFIAFKNDNDICIALPKNHSISKMIMDEEVLSMFKHKHLYSSIYDHPEKWIKDNHLLVPIDFLVFCENYKRK